MKATRSAQRTLDTLARYYTAEALAPVVTRATEIARGRKSTRLGRVHLDLALEALALEAAEVGDHGQ